MTHWEVGSMRDRLIKQLCSVKCEGEEKLGNCPQRRDSQCRTVQKLEMCQIGAIADHLLANGVIAPPCKVGDIIYVISQNKKEYYPLKVPSRDTVVQWMDKGLFGKQLFVTEREAEQALKGEHHAEIH
jgi:hypothetical protein